MKAVITLSVLTLFLFASIQTKAQVSKDSELYLTLKANDSLLFNQGFNQCDISKFENLIASDFEFYHDQSGVINSKEAFMNGIKNGLCNPSNTTKSRRELVDKTLEVHPLYDNGELYGAIQKGVHRFYESTNNQPESKGSIANFSHLWIKENNHWKLKRVLSFNHLNQEN